MEYIATTFQGLEEILAKELTALGVEVTQIYTRAVGFIADKAMLYKANLHLRTAIRILQPISRFDVNNCIRQPTILTGRIISICRKHLRYKVPFIRLILTTRSTLP